MPAADVEPVLGAGHGDVEQAAILLVPAALGFGAGLGADLLLEAAPRRPDRQVLAPQDRRACRRLRRRIGQDDDRSEEHTSELQSLIRTSYAVFCLKKKKHSCRTYITTTTTLLILQK